LQKKIKRRESGEKGIRREKGGKRSEEDEGREGRRKKK
jgi:hypothetical protein